MLGRDYQRRQKLRLPNLAQTARPRTTTTNRYATNSNVNGANETEGDDDDAEGGRSSLGKRLRNNDNDDGGGGRDAKGVERLAARKKRPVIYLDEVLSAKSQKQRKKKMKKEGKKTVP